MIERGQNAVWFEQSLFFQLLGCFDGAKLGCLLHKSACFGLKLCFDLGYFWVMQGEQHDPTADFTSDWNRVSTQDDGFAGSLKRDDLRSDPPTHATSYVLNRSLRLVPNVSMLCFPSLQRPDCAVPTVYPRWLFFRVLWSYSFESWKRLQSLDNTLEGAFEAIKKQLLMHQKLVQWTWIGREG